MCADTNVGAYGHEYMFNLMAEVAK
jgi:hypothetical protein